MNKFLTIPAVAVALTFGASSAHAYDDANCALNSGGSVSPDVGFRRGHVDDPALNGYLDDGTRIPCHRVTAEELASGDTAEPVQVQPAAAVTNTARTLPATGSGTTVLALTAGALVAVGTMMRRFTS